MEEEHNRCLFVLLPREIQLLVVSVIEDVDDLLSLVQVATFNHSLNKDGFIIREVWLRIAKQLNWNVSETSLAWIKRTAKKVGSGRYCLYCGRTTKAKIPLSWMAEYNIRRRICLDCFTSRKGVNLLTRRAISGRFPGLDTKKLGFLEYRYDSNKDHEFLLSQVERLATGEYVPPTEFKTAFQLHYNRPKGSADNKKFNNNNNNMAKKPKKSNFLKDLEGPKPKPVNTKVSPFFAFSKPKSDNNSTNSNTNNNNVQDPIVVNDDFPPPKIKKTRKARNNANINTPRKIKPKESMTSDGANEKSNNNTVANEDQIIDSAMTDQPQIFAESEQNNINIIEEPAIALLVNNTENNESTNLSASKELIKPKISRKRAIKPKTTSELGESATPALKTPFKRPRKIEDQLPTDENGLAVPSPKKKLKKNNVTSPTKLGDNNAPLEARKSIVEPSDLNLVRHPDPCT